MVRGLRRGLQALLLAACLGGCSSFVVVNTTPLPASKLEPADSDTISAEVGGGTMQNIAQSPDALRAQGYDRLRRILVISVDGQGAQDASVAQRKIVGGVFSRLGLVSGGQIDRYNFETLSAVTQQLRDIERGLRTARCSRARLIDGAPCDDVQAELVHVSLAGIPEGPEKTALPAIPTGLTVTRNDADLLVAAGEAAVTGSEPLRRFLANYPPHPAPANPTPIRTSGGER